MSEKSLTPADDVSVGLWQCRVCGAFIERPVWLSLWLGSGPPPGDAPALPICRAHILPVGVFGDVVAQLAARNAVLAILSRQKGAAMPEC